MDHDYKKLGLRIGLEIHQQLNSATKLFCRCPITRSEYFPIEVRRKLRAVPGELGVVDEAAMQEYLRNRTFVYRANNESSCLVELDDDPPKRMNAKALLTALQVCKLLHCRVLDELHVMRKTVVDGSTVSGFQRTVLVGLNGSIEGAFGRVVVATITLEEDAATPVAKEGTTVEYRLDRLGIPLIELATDSSINSPQMAKDVAQSIGMLLRSTDVVRGIGSIRQDINISIADGARIEIKGFQELDKIPDVVENEVARQLSLLDIKNELTKRGFSRVSTPRDVTKLFADTKSNFIRRALDAHGSVRALLLPKFAGLLARKCGDRTFGKELSAYAAAYGLGIMHSDEDVSRYALEFEFGALRKEMNAGQEDLILITAGLDAKQIENALALVAKRADQCARGVPEETRVADGTGSKYARPLPGSGRLYPESDIPPIEITSELRAVETPKTLEQRQKEIVGLFVRKGMKESLANFIVTARTVNNEEIKSILDFSDAYKSVDINAIAKMIIEIPKEIKKRFSLEPAIGESAYAKILAALSDKKIPEDAVLQILVDHLKGQPVGDAIEKYAQLTDSELKRIIRNVVDENKGRTESALMGLVMQQVRGRAPGEKIMKMIREMM